MGKDKIKEPVIIIDIPLEENFRAQWRWVAKTGKPKEQWPGFRTLERYLTTSQLQKQPFIGIYYHTCFPCGTRKKIRNAKLSVRCHCPINWKSNLKECPCIGNTLYMKYIDNFCSNNEQAKKIALQISKLRWRK